MFSVDAVRIFITKTICHGDKLLRKLEIAIVADDVQHDLA
jgi:hypothetical protein